MDVDGYPDLGSYKNTTLRISTKLDWKPIVVRQLLQKQIFIKCNFFGKKSYFYVLSIQIYFYIV